MNILKESIKNDLKNYNRNDSKEGLNSLRIICGELERQPNKDLSDSEVISILKKLETGEKECLKFKGIETSTLLTFLQKYIPKQADEKELLEFMKTIDFSSLKNPMQAINLFKKKFGNSVDGNVVKKLIEERLNNL